MSEPFRQGETRELAPQVEVTLKIKRDHYRIFELTAEGKTAKVRFNRGIESDDEAKLLQAADAINEPPETEADI